MKKRLPLVIFLLVLTTSVFLRLYHLNFGLPYMTFADEDKLGSPAIKITSDVKGLFRSPSLSKVAPGSYVYGSFPMYLNAIFLLFYKLFLLFFKKEIDIYGIYLSLRVANLPFSLIPAFAFGYMAFRMRRSWVAGLVCFSLLALNWKILVHAHYLNADIILTALLSLVFLLLYFARERPSLVFFAGAVFGLGVGTKITALISVPLFVAYLIYAYRLKGLVLFGLASVASFFLTNPFVAISFGSFSSRVIEMRVRENGIVFDSLDLSVTKYLASLISIVSLPMLLLFVLSIRSSLKGRNLAFELLLLSNLSLYLLFFSISTRRVDRWLLPVIPVVVYFVSLGVLTFFEKARAKVSIFACVFVFILSGLIYLYPSFLLISQFQRHTSQTAAFLWAKNNLKTPNPKLLVTNSLLDPSREIKGMKQLKVKVYGADGAQFQVPEDPLLYEYVIVFEGSIDHVRNPQIQRSFPFYVDKWSDFLVTINQFDLVKKFPAPDRDLIPVSSVRVYKNPRFVPQTPLEPI